MLEVFAQIIAFAAFAQLMPPTVVAFIDNTAEQAALTKGYGKDPAINGMISAFWTLAARRGWFVEFERVPSKANVADAVSKPRGSSRHRSGSSGWGWFVCLLGSLSPLPAHSGSSSTCHGHFSAALDNVHVAGASSTVHYRDDVLDFAA